MLLTINHGAISSAAVAAALLAFLSYKLILLPFFNPLRQIPGPPTRKRLFSTHLPAVLNAERSAAIQEKLVQMYGRNIHIKGAGFWDDRLLSLDHTAVNYILNNPSKYQKPWQSRRLITRLIGCGMLAAEGVVHKRQRKVSTPAFSPQNLKGFVPLFFEKANELADKWDSTLAVSPDRLDICHWISRATFDVIGLAGFGYAFNAIQEESNDVYLAYKDMFEIAISQNVSFKSIIAIYFPIVWKLFPDESSRAVDKSWKVILRTGRQLVNSKRELIESGKTEEKDLLSLMLMSNLSTDTPIEQRISDDDLLFQISTFLFAGSDTTSLALTWTILTLSKPLHQHLQERLRIELNSLDSTLNPAVLFSDIDRLPFLDKIVKEGLRLIPPVHSSLRVATTNDVIPTSEPVLLSDGSRRNGVVVNKGTLVHVPVEGFALDREIWGADAWEFNPDRWDSLPERVKLQSGLYSNLLSFSSGPRSCIGMRFSIIEMKIMLYTLIRRFRFQDPAQVFKANVVLTRPYVTDQFKEGSKCPITVVPIH